MMKNLTLIAAIGKNRELGYNNDLIWHFKEDMKFFKENTMGKPIIMGRKTLESLPRLLPGRKHIVLTHQDINISGVIIVHSKEELYDVIKSEEEAMVIGGASIYQMFIDDASKMLLTHIYDEKKADVFFPKFNQDDYEKQLLGLSEENDTMFEHILYKKKYK